MDKNRKIKAIDKRIKELAEELKGMDGSEKNYTYKKALLNSYVEETRIDRIFAKIDRMTRNSK